MIVDTSPPGSLEWFMARAGVITASVAHLTRAEKRLKTGANKGQYGSEAKNLAFRLGIERISGLPLGIDEGFSVWQAERGKGLEPHAKFAHECKAQILVEKAGFICTDDRLFGGTADGFAWVEHLADMARAGCEYKCFLDPSKLRDILLFDDTESVIDQCDMGMWISELRLWHFGLYCPALTPIGLDFTLIPIECDDDRMHELVQDLWTFNLAVEEVVTRLRQRAGLGAAPRIAESDPELAREVNADLPKAITELPEDIFF